jgi:S-DNA-T family DNA segregation ATPase FtsK/SpoIIIE
MQFRQGMVDTVPEPEYSEPVPEEFPFEGDAIEQSRSAPPFDM